MEHLGEFRGDFVQVFENVHKMEHFRKFLLVLTDERIRFIKITAAKTIKITYFLELRNYLGNRQTSLKISKKAQK